MKKARLVLTFLISLLLISSSFAGCGKNTVKQEGGADSGNQNSTTAPKKNITLKYWVPMHVDAATNMKNYGESEMYKELEKRTGVNIEFIHPAQGQAQEQFNLMIASKDLPDIISQYANTYPGGVDKAIDDGIYLKLNDLVEKNAPNYKKLRENNKELARQTITDAGNIWAFYCIHLTEEAAWWGPAIRKDWLDELGLKVPGTIDEWYTVLKAFKEKKNPEAPMLWPKEGVDWAGAFQSAYNIGYEFYNDNGTVKYAGIESGYKEFLTLMNKFYKEGLIDKDFATRDDKSLESMITSGRAGAMVTAWGSLDLYNNVMKAKDPKALLVAAPYPGLKPGENVKYRQKNYFNHGTPTVVTTSCRAPEEAVKWLDYAYGDEGSLLFNYGIENVSYKMVNGKPEFTDLILKNPQGLSYNVLAWKYKLHMGPYMRNPDAMPPPTKEVEDCKTIWSKAGSEFNLPLINRTAEESKKYSTINTQIKTYVDEMTLKFIVGSEPISKFDEYVKQIKKMNIDEAIKIQQAALDRYNKR